MIWRFSTRRRQTRLGTLLVWLILTGVAPSGQQRPTFRSNVDVVTVDVSVMAGRTPVLGLTEHDFHLLDNGVAQRIELTTVESLPIDVTVLVDTGYLIGVRLDQFKKSLERLPPMLRPQDRFRLLTLEPRLVVDFRSTVSREVLSSIREGHAVVLHDTLAQVMMRTSEPGRRHLIAAFSSSAESGNVLTREAVLEVARRSDALLELVLVKPPLYEMAVRAGLKGTIDRYRDFLRETTEITGGSVLENVSSDDISREFKRLFDNYRQSYVLHYTPQGVAPAGWHELSVKLTKPGKFQIRARKGYVGRSFQP
jgi:VWFA-related protein